MKQSQQQSQHQQNQGLGNSQGNPVGNNNMDIEEKMMDKILTILDMGKDFKS